VVNAALGQLGNLLELALVSGQVLVPGLECMPQE